MSVRGATRGSSVYGACHGPETDCPQPAPYPLSPIPCNLSPVTYPLFPTKGRMVLIRRSFRLTLST